MPIYEYECPVCGFKVERIEHTPDSQLPKCPRLKEHRDDRRAMIKCWSAPTAHFRGGGWSKDGYSSITPVRGPDGKDLKGM